MTPRRARNALLAVTVSLTLAFAHAAGASSDAPAKDEIDHLLNFVAASSCTFVRNGTEYPSDKAREHLADQIPIRGEPHFHGRGIYQVPRHAEQHVGRALSREMRQGGRLVRRVAHERAETLSRDAAPAARFALTSRPTDRGEAFSLGAGRIAPAGSSGKRALALAESPRRIERKASRGGRDCEGARPEEARNVPKCT